MTHTFITVIAFLPIDRIAAARALGMALGNPANAPAAKALDDLARIHFLSLNVFEASAGDRGYIVFEISADGPREEVLKALDAALGAQLAPIFALATDRGAAPLHEYWAAKAVLVGQRPFANPGLEFAGTPGLSVARIRRERDLAAYLAGLLREPASGPTALQHLDIVRKAVRNDPAWSWALEPEPLAQGGTVSDLPTSFAGVLRLVGGLAVPFVQTFLWPFAPVPIVLFLVFWWALRFTGPGAVAALLLAIPMTLIVVAIVLLALYSALRKRENAELPVDRAPEAGAVAAILARENYAAQNHLGARSVMKPGPLRRLTVTFAFWVIAQLSARYFRTGFLGSLGTIHFARWVTVPGTGDLLFMSNYGGSWESYLEDFITKAHAGLTGVWSNTTGFPQASNLFEDGATDGERFKRWARRQQIPTAFWYAAYPDLTTANIRTNAVIRQGLGAAMTEDEARQWFSLFGSGVRPIADLESNEIQSLVFGGLGFLHEGSALLFALSEDKAAAKAWLRELLPAVSFADGRHLSEAAILGLAATALPKLGLPPDSVATFSPAFVDGMAAPWRSRALGDVGPNAPETWWWGGNAKEPVDGVLVLYAKARPQLEALHARAVDLLRKHGHVERRTIPFRPLPGAEATQEQKFQAKCEPFGFVDGISQPIIHGTYKALRGADPIHLVESGEFILGYPDNRGTIPPSPMLPAIHDPSDLLAGTAAPASDFSSNTLNADRDLGRNGSFLAIRQLEQNVEAFWQFCEAEGQRQQNYFPAGMQAPPAEFIAAKIVGRWRDGSPLTRYPRYPATDAPVPAHPLSRTGTSAAATIAQAPEQVAAQIPAAPAKVLRTFDKQVRGAGDAVLAGAPAAAAPAKKHGAAAPAEEHGGAARPKPEPEFEADNDFLFGTEDPQGLRCPYGAHIRRANPRESLDPGSLEQLSITNRHRIMRVGRFYEPQPGEDKGLFFMCLNGDLERQFEFVQQTWVQGSFFHGLANERDPLIGDRRGQDGYTVPTRDGPMRLAGLPAFVRTRGGGYFFVPGRRTLLYLAS